MRRLVAVSVAALAMCLGVGHGDALSSRAPHPAAFYRNTGEEVVPSVKPNGLQLSKLSYRTGVSARRARVSLAARARYLAAHGGITGHCYACATSRMKALVRALIRETFRPAGWAAVSHALCYSRREAGWNPAADSPSDDHGAFQSHRSAHPQFNYDRINWDPAYSVWVGWSISSHGTDWSAWRGGVHPC